MKWIGRRESSNVEDERGNSGGGGFNLGGGGLKFGGGITLLIIIGSLIMGKNPMQVLSLLQGSGTPTEQSAPVASSASEDSMAHFVRVVLADNEDIWTDMFQQMNKPYKLPKLVMFRNSTQSGCGGASASTGPFYCPADEKVYIDLAFYDEMKNRFHAGGDFAMAYVIAHEVGHHVQNMLGISEKVQRQREQLSKEEANKLSVKLELQADFFAGIWAHYDQKTKNVLEAGDIDEALNAASAVGDDKLQMQAQGYVVPDAFTHGTSKQRMYWFKKGFETGDINQGNTFSEN